MAVNPTTPNLTDYISFWYGVVGIPEDNLPSASGAATGGDINTLIDLFQTWDINQWTGYSAVDVTQNETASIISNDQVNLNFTAPVANPVLPGDQYLIVPDIVPTSLAIAREIVNETLAQVSASIYTLAVYNLAADRLVNFASDVEGQTYFGDLRGQFRILDVSVGVPSSANDSGVGVGILNPEQMKMFTLQDLQTLKTPMGRQYMGFAQAYGPSIWGLS
jgi:hypothetical protein